MTLGEYVGNLQQMMIDDPETENMKAVFATDEEGNEFHEVDFTPVRGNFDGEDFYSDTDDFNAVCVN